MSTTQLPVAYTPPSSQELAELAPLTSSQLLARLALIQSVMKATMKEDEDYGTPFGGDDDKKKQKPSLYKQGAEKLAVVFKLTSGEPTIEDLSYGGYERRYRVRVPILTSAGVLLAVGVGEASTEEEKYAWRRPGNSREWDATPEDRRRIKYKTYRGEDEEWKQVRTNPGDVANTVLKMAHKRAYVHGVIMATGCSAMFTQDLEDLPEDLRGGDDHRSTNGRKTAPQPPKPATTPASGLEGPFTITDVKEKSGSNAKGPWTQYAVTFSDGKRASTFSKTHGELAIGAHRLGSAVLRRLERQGDFLNIIDLQDAPATESREPGEEG